MRPLKYALSIIIGLAVLAAVVQAVPPTPRQTPDSPTSTSKGGQNNTNPKNGPAEPGSSAINKQEQTKNHNEPRKQQTEADTQHSVTIRELPPVTVNSRRDWADWGTWFFTFLLVITSALQVWLLCRTLAFVRRQTHEIKRQRGFMRLQWKAMQGQIDLAERQFLLTHRPWVSVTGTIENGYLAIDERGLASISISYSVKNGGAAAAIATVVLHSELRVEPMPKTPEKARAEIGCGKNGFRASSGTMGILVLPGDSFEIKDFILQCRINPGSDGPQEVWFTQCISYTDELGGVHGTGLLWRFDPDGNRTIQVRKPTIVQGRFTRIGFGNESY